MSTSISRQLSVKAKLELLLLINYEHADELINFTTDNGQWKFVGHLIPACFEHYGSEPLAGVTNEALALAVNNADVYAFVQYLFRGDDALYIPGVRPSAELIPTIVKAFKEKSSAQQFSFRSLHLRFINAPLNFRFYELWPDAAERRIRPCAYCSSEVVGSMDIANDHQGLRLTIELLYLWLDSYPAGWDGPRKRLRDRVTAVRIFTDVAFSARALYPKDWTELVFLKQAEILEEVFRFAVRDDLDTFQLVCRHFHTFVNGRADALALRAFYDVWLVRPVP